MIWLNIVNTLMKGLLDTHTLLWFVAGNSQLSDTAREFIERDDTEIYVSIASLWELTIKNSLGKLELSAPLAQFFEEAVEGNGFLVLPIEMAHLIEVHSLPFHHRDPFDRLLLAQSKAEEMAFVSGDVAMDAYGVKRLW
jgi:PIN domain nuclease of toxin-antitoxin system